MRRLAVFLAVAVAVVLVLPNVMTARGNPVGVHTNRDGARTLPLPDDAGVFHFLVFGDRTGSPPSSIEILRTAVADANLLGPDLVLTVGDLINGYNGHSAWMDQMVEFRAVMDGLDAPWFPVPGNHDVYWAGSPAPRGHHESDYERHFGPLWYWFGHKNAAFFALYSDEGDRETNRKGWNRPAVNQMSTEQLDWLESALADAQGYEHVFVFLHHPRWIERSYPGSNWDAVHARLKEAGNVTAVFAGHIHRQRYDGTRDGIEYFTLGTTGGAVPLEAPGTGYLHHLNLVTVRTTGVTVATIPVGTTLDPRELTPERWREIDALRRATPRFETPGLVLEASGRARCNLAFALENPTKRPIYVTASMEEGDRGWYFVPGHHHVEIPAGGKTTVRWECGRDTMDGLEALVLPELSLQVDYLATSSRVALPERRIPPPWRLSRPSLASADAQPHAVHLADGACLGVPGHAARLPDGPFTLEGWIRADDYQGRCAFLAKSESSDYGIFVSDGRPSFSVWLGSRYTTASVQKSVLRVGRWHHVAGTYDGTRVLLHVDGRLVAARDGTGRRRVNRHPLWIGGDPDKSGRPTSTVRGLIDEVRLSTVARYGDAKFRPSRRNEVDDDTFLLLHLDAGLGPIAVDAGKGQRHALRHGTVRYVPVD